MIIVSVWGEFFTLDKLCKFLNVRGLRFIKSRRTSHALVSHHGLSLLLRGQTQVFFFGPNWNVSFIWSFTGQSLFSMMQLLKKGSLLFTRESLVNHYFQWPQVSQISVTMPFNMEFHIDYDWRQLMTLNAAQLNNDTKTDTEGKLLCFFLEKQKKISSLLKKNYWPAHPPATLQRPN